MDFKEMIAEQQSILDTARSQMRELTPEEVARFDSLQRSIDAGQLNQSVNTTETEAVKNERKRMQEIFALCRDADVDPNKYIEDGSDLNTVRKAILDQLLQRGAPIPRGMKPDEEDTFRYDAVNSLLMRSGVPVENPSKDAESLRELSLRDMAIECLVRSGEGTTTSLLRMGKNELYDNLVRQFFNPTAAFPAILDNAIKKNIVHAYNHVPTTFQLWTSKGSVTDFKPTKDHSYLAGGAGDFLLVGENGELKGSTPKTDLVPQRKVDTYGRQFSMSRQAFINDDVGFMTELPSLYARSAKRTINKQVYQILVDNPAIFDGVALFDTAHGNLVESGAAPDVENMQKMMLMLLSQKDPFGDSIMVQPKYVVVPVGYGFLMSQLLNTAVIDVEGIGSHTANALYQYRNQLQVVEEGTINALSSENPMPWFMVGDTSYAKSIQVDYLNGQETPTIRRSEVPGKLGYVWDIYLDWGITALDFRGITKNPGVAMK